MGRLVNFEMIKNELGFVWYFDEDEYAKAKYMPMGKFIHCAAVHNTIMSERLHDIRDWIETSINSTVITTTLTMGYYHNVMNKNGIPDGTWINHQYIRFFFINEEDMIKFNIVFGDISVHKFTRHMSGSPIDFAINQQMNYHTNEWPINTKESTIRNDY